MSTNKTVVVQQVLFRALLYYNPCYVMYDNRFVFWNEWIYTYTPAIFYFYFVYIFIFFFQNFY